MSGSAPFKVRLRAIIQETDDIHLLTFRPLRREMMPTFEPGAHIDLHLNNGLIRSYSLVNPFDGNYTIAVKKEPAGRGGSRFVHSDLRVGEDVMISPPRNNFLLQEDAAFSVFIGGGIGITPLLCMARRMEQLSRQWELHYAFRDPEQAAFVPQLSDLRPKTHFYTRAAPLDIGSLVARLPDHTHIYCCGPLRMLADFEVATAARPADHVHVEYFSAPDAPSTKGGFDVLLRRSGERITVMPGKTILDALIACGMDVPFSCMEGICGSCETQVLDGIPDHRDMILSKEEKAGNNKMIICCSGSKSATLVLDL